MDQLEARGAKALSLVEQGDVEGATLQIGKGLEIIDKFGFGTATQPPVQVAQVMFAEGEIRRLRSETIKLVPLTPDFPERLDARCRGLLNAQSAYTEAMRARDSHWSAMSGFRVGQLYMQLHAEAMTIPPPAQATTLKQKQLFEGALRLRYRTLLEKGLRMMDGTARIGDRTGEDSEWIARAREAKRTLEQALEDEKRALAALPYTEEELRKGLDSLKGKSTASAGAATPTTTQPAEPSKPAKPAEPPKPARSAEPAPPHGPASVRLRAGARRPRCVARRSRGAPPPPRAAARAGHRRRPARGAHDAGRRPREPRASSRRPGHPAEREEAAGDPVRSRTRAPRGGARAAAVSPAPATWPRPPRVRTAAWSHPRERP